jgi:hypothetical protein
VPGGTSRNFVPKLRPAGYGQVIAKGNYLPPELPLVIPGPYSDLPLRKGL